MVGTFPLSRRLKRVRRSPTSTASSMKRRPSWWRAAECCLDPLKFENIPIEDGTEHAISRASYHIAKEVGAAAIITPTWSGATACLVSRFRPKQLILAPTPNESALDFLALCWGV